MSDTATVQQWIDDQRRPVNDRRAQRVGVFRITDTLRVDQSMGLVLAGGGGVNRSPNPGWDRFRCNTILQWEGPPDKPILECVGCSGLVLSGLNFRGKASQGVLIRDGAGSLNIEIEKCGFEGMVVGVQCGVEKGESTCANVTYTSCMWENCTEAAVRMCNSQSLEQKFERPKFAHTPVCVDVQAGGNVTINSGGPYECGSLLRLGDMASNTRGFSVNHVRFDGKRTRTAWVTFVEPEAAWTYGTITFRNCAQNTGQRDSDLPLFTVAPGSRVVAEHCSFHYARTRAPWCVINSNRRATGEFVARECDGIWPAVFGELVESKGPAGYWAFDRCGDFYHGAAGSFSTFPDELVATDNRDAATPDQRE